MTKRLNDEHNMRRLEQKELVQRLDNNETTGKAEISELFTKLKREQARLFKQQTHSENNIKKQCHQIRANFTTWPNFKYLAF